MSEHPRPHPKALARHLASCRDESPVPLDELHALAGKWDRYPAPPDRPECCPVCGGEPAPLATYCGDACRREGQKRLMAAAFRKRDDDIAPFNW